MIGLYTEATLSSRTWILLRFETAKKADCCSNNKHIVLFNIIFGTLSFPVVLRGLITRHVGGAKYCARCTFVRVSG